MNIPDNLFYTKEHEWARVEKNLATVGITDYAQHSLGDITFVELPKAGYNLTQFKKLATVESVKAASDVYAPFSGKAVKVNDRLVSSPELINKSAYGDGWLAVIEIKDLKEKERLLSAADYKKYIEGLSK
jgi:glycine cleavage system H protein